MIRIKKIKPMFTGLVTTMDRYTEDIFTDGGLLDMSRKKGMVKEYQKVLCVGSSVRDIKEGDLVCINPTRFAVKKHKEGTLKDGIITDNPVVEYNFDIIELNGIPCLYLQDRDIDFIITDFEEVEDIVTQTSSNLYIPPKEKIITLT